MSRRNSDIGFIIVTLIVTITLIYVYITHEDKTEKVSNDTVITNSMPRIVPPSRTKVRPDLSVPPTDLPKPEPTFTPKPKPTPEPEVTEDTTTVTKTKNVSNSNLPYGLQLVRSCESGPWKNGGCGYNLSLYNYNAYNATGCEGYGCYGAYQMHAKYMGAWAVEAGFPNYNYAGIWPSEIQDAVALYKWNASNGHLWCDWASYC